MAASHTATTAGKKEGGETRNGEAGSELCFLGIIKGSKKNVEMSFLPIVEITAAENELEEERKRKPTRMQ